MKIPPAVLPREHGAWAVLLVPVVSAAIFTRMVSADFFLLLLSTLMVFMSHAPLEVIVRQISGTPQRPEKFAQAKFWASAYCALALAFIVPVLLDGHPGLIPVGLLALAALAATSFLTWNSPRTISGDLVAVIGLTLGGPAAYYVLQGSFDREAFLLWLFNFLFFGYSVFYVHTKMKASATKKFVLSIGEKLRIGRYLIAYAILAAAALSLLLFNHVAPEYTLLAFVPMTTQSLFGMVNLSGKVSFKRLGLALLGQAILFAILLGLLR